MKGTARSRLSDAVPFWLPVAAGLPIALSLLVMAIPSVGHGQSLVYRLFYVGAFLLWTLPLTALQRALWRRDVPGWAMVLGLLAVTYLMALINRAGSIALGEMLGWRADLVFRWAELVRGLEVCWPALIAFCATHAVVAHYAALKQAQLQAATTQAMARDAELRALRYQLQPHFLFNTLNAISSLMEDQRVADARRVLGKLAEFLRATLASDGNDVTLAEEIALNESYLAIEKARLGERLQVQWQIGERLLGARVPVLLLQPLIENAIRHGIAQRRTPGLLRIVIQAVGEQLQISLHNDLPGTGPDNRMPEDASTSGSVPTAAAPPTHGVGLRNVAARLAHLYPLQHSFSAGPDSRGGYQVTLNLPLQRNENSPESIVTARAHAAVDTGARP